MSLHIIVVLLSFVFACVFSHQAEVSAPWQIPVHEAHSFLTKPTRFKRSDPRCNTEEVYCENNKASCMQHNEQSREYYCGLGHSCSPTQACFLSVPCPAHYTLGCSDDLCLSLPCYNGGSCTDTGTTHSCSCVPGWDSATDCSTDYDECQSTPCLNGGSCNNLFNDFTCDCNDRFEGEICEKDCRPGPVDIVFIVDTSKSMETSVNKSIDYIEQFIRRVPIGHNDFQVGVVTYNLNATVMFDLDDFTTKSDISNALRTIIGEDGPTITAPALRKAYQIITSSSYGARTGSTYKYIILLHDGLSTDRNEAIQEANKLSALGMRIYTVAIGDSISHMEMLMISTQQYHTFSPLKSDDMYHQMMKETAHHDCTDCAIETSTEVLMLLDTSSNQTFENYLKRSTAIRHAIEALLSYNSVTNIGMYSYSDDLDLVFPLAWSHDKDDLISAALQVSRDSHLSTPNTSHALSHLRTNNIFSASSRKIVIILSNGVWSDQDNVMSEIEQLANDGIDVKSILTGDDSKSIYFNDVLQDPSYNYYIEDSDYSALDSLAATTKRYVCIKDIFTKRQ